MALDRSIEDAVGMTGIARQQQQAPVAPVAPAEPSPAAPSPETPPDVGGSMPPPPSAGDEAPNRTFPVPPVPPPPSPGPIFGLAGSGGGGATSFARPGTEAAKPFRSQLFATNRSTGSGAPVARFGAGTPVTTGGLPSFLPAGLEGQSAAGGAAGDEELKRILAIMRGGGAGA